MIHVVSVFKGLVMLKTNIGREIFRENIEYIVFMKVMDKIRFKIIFPLPKRTCVYQKLNQLVGTKNIYLLLIELLFVNKSINVSVLERDGIILGYYVIYENS